jgi:hypothetical protein
MSTVTKAEPGTVSHGTMRTQDLLDAFLPVLEEHDPSAYDRVTAAREAFLISFLNEDVWDAMQDIAPGSDFGFWPNPEETN